MPPALRQAVQAARPLPTGHPAVSRLPPTDPWTNRSSSRSGPPHTHLPAAGGQELAPHRGGLVQGVCAGAAARVRGGPAPRRHHRQQQGRAHAAVRGRGGARSPRPCVHLLPPASCCCSSDSSSRRHTFNSELLSRPAGLMAAGAAGGGGERAPSCCCCCLAHWAWRCPLPLHGLQRLRQGGLRLGAQSNLGEVQGPVRSRPGRTSIRGLAVQLGAAAANSQAAGVGQSFWKQGVLRLPTPPRASPAPSLHCTALHSGPTTCTAPASLQGATFHSRLLGCFEPRLLRRPGCVHSSACTPAATPRA